MESIERGLITCSSASTQTLLGNNNPPEPKKKKKLRNRWIQEDDERWIQEYYAEGQKMSSCMFSSFCLVYARLLVAYLLYLFSQKTRVCRAFCNLENSAAGYTKPNKMFSYKELFFHCATASRICTDKTSTIATLAHRACFHGVCR